jgi:hypothetical protein
MDAGTPETTAGIVGSALLHLTAGLIDLAFKLLVIAAAGKYVGVW